MAKYQAITKDHVNAIMVELDNESVVLESGAMHYMQGNISVETKNPGLGGVLKAGVTGENIFRPTYTGTGRIMLAPSFDQFFTLTLNNETMILDQGAFLACDASVEISAKRNKLMSGLRSGEGLFQTSVSGSGTVIARAQGPIQVVELNNDTLTVDGSFAAARSDTLEFNVEKISKSLIGSAASGEGFVQVLKGTGRVYLAPLPNYANMLGQLIYSSMYAYRSTS